MFFYLKHDYSVILPAFLNGLQRPNFNDSRIYNLAKFSTELKNLTVSKGFQKLKLSTILKCKIRLQIY